MCDFQIFVKVIGKGSDPTSSTINIDNQVVM